jgi:hypothetical protein
MNLQKDPLKYLFEQGTCTGGVKPEEIAFVEQMFDLHFPDSYRQFLQRCGTMSFGPIEINGLGVPFNSPLSLVKALNALQTVCPDAPKGLIPIRLAGIDLLHCLFCDSSSGNKPDAPVYLFDLNTSSIRSPRISEGFSYYLNESLTEWKYRERGLTIMERHVRAFEEEYLKNNKLPRNHIWRPYRFCVQDVVLGLVVVRHSLANNCLDVDVCLISDAPDYEPGSGARMTSAFLLSEAYKCGGTMEIRFTENVEDRSVPRVLQEFAQDLGVELRHVGEGRITASEARQLYIALTGFSDSLCAQIDFLAQQGNLSQERVCYVVHHGIWTRSEVESIVFGSLRPDGIFSGDTPPEQRHLYMQEIFHARAAILGGLLDRRLARRERIEGTVAIDLEDDVRRLDIEFDPNFYAKIYRCEEELLVPWVEPQDQKSLTIPPGHRLITLVRARNASDLALYFQQDISTARGVTAIDQGQQVPGSVFILTPRDFHELPSEQQNHFVGTARNSGVGIIVCPETVAALDADAAKRLASSRILR